MAAVELMAKRRIIVARDEETGVTTVTVLALATDGVQLYPITASDTLTDPADAATLYGDLSTTVATAVSEIGT